MNKMGFWAMVIKTKVANIVFTNVNFVRYRCFLECQKNLMTLNFGGYGLDEDQTITNNNLTLSQINNVVFKTSPY